MTKPPNYLQVEIFMAAVAFETDKKQNNRKLRTTTEGLRPLLLFGLVKFVCFDSCLLTSFCLSCIMQEGYLHHARRVLASCKKGTCITQEGYLHHARRVRYTFVRRILDLTREYNGV